MERLQQNDDYGPWLLLVLSIFMLAFVFDMQGGMKSPMCVNLFMARKSTHAAGKL